MSACKPYGFRPSVWKDDAGWVCDQNVACATCGDVWNVYLAEDVTWAEAMEASRNARPIR